MYDLHSSRYEPDSKPRWKRFFLFVSGFLFIGGLIFISGFFLGIKIQTKKQSLQTKTENPIPKQIQGGTEETKPEAPHGTNKESEEHKTDEKDLTFYQTLTANKKQVPVGLESTQNRGKKTKDSSVKTGDSNKIYTVQVGAYKEIAVAEKVRNKLKNKGYHAYIVNKEVPQEGTIYKVRVGEFPYRDMAEEIARKIKEKENMPTFVTLK